MNEQEKVIGSLSDMLNWMKESGVEVKEIDGFSQKVLNRIGGISKMGRAKNCQRYISGTCGDGSDESCMSYTIECCTTFDDGETICDSTTVCRC